MKISSLWKKLGYDSITVMTRVAWYRLGYSAVVVALGTAVAAFIISTGEQIPIMLAVIALLLVPGRIQKSIFRDFYQGRRLLGSAYYAQAAESFERFLRVTQAQPWRKRLIWLSWPIYTTDIEAMALNNLGAARLWLGDLPSALSAFRKALKLDPHYAQPYFNIAVLQVMEGDHEAARQSAQQALTLGYTGATLDAVTQAAQSLQSGSAVP